MGRKNKERMGGGGGGRLTKETRKDGYVEAKEADRGREEGLNREKIRGCKGREWGNAKSGKEKDVHRIRQQGIAGMMKCGT